MPNPLPPGVLPGQLSFGDDFDTLAQGEIEAAHQVEPDPAPVAPETHLATPKEGVGRSCQVCDFPAIAGRVQGEIDGERYSLLICQSCLQHAVLCLRDDYRQCRLFEDDFEIEELCGFGKVKKPGLHELLERSDLSAPDAGYAKDWEEARPLGKEFGTDDAQQVREILERVKKGEEQTFSSEEVRKDLGLDNDE
ncbi:hypothetical protein NG726_27515 [Pseudomonas sp. MOB-449]|nr:hypothetical protein [Pseudomonas sp. MOB-449]